MGCYSSTKYALEAFSLCLIHELESFGMSVHLVRPSMYKTGVTNPQVFEEQWMELYNRQSTEEKKRLGATVQKCKF